MELGSSISVTLCSATFLGGQGPTPVEFIFNCPVSSDRRRCFGDNL